MWLSADWIIKVLFPIIPQISNLERMKKGGDHWGWRSDVPFYLGVLPRRGAKGSDVKVSSQINLVSPGNLL